MSIIDRVLVRREFWFGTDLSLEACRQRLATNPDSTFTASVVAYDEFNLEKTVRRVLGDSGRSRPPVVRAHLTTSASGTRIAVRGRLNYVALVRALLLALIVVGGPLVVVIVATIQNGRPPNGIGAVFLYVVIMPTLIYVSTWASLARQSAQLAYRFAAVLEAHSEAAP